jgi:DNA invertase Pin-like site-specific DNA recombinase
MTGGGFADPKPYPSTTRPHTEFKRALIRERTAAGLAEARRKSRVSGRPKGMQPKDVAAARTLLAEGSLQ